MVEQAMVSGNRRPASLVLARTAKLIATLPAGDVDVRRLEAENQLAVHVANATADNTRPCPLDHDACAQPAQDMANVSPLRECTA